MYVNIPIQENVTAYFQCNVHTKLHSVRLFTLVGNCFMSVYSVKVFKLCNSTYLMATSSITVNWLISCGKYRKMTSNYICQLRISRMILEWFYKKNL